MLGFELEGELDEAQRGRIAKAFDATLASEPRAKARLARRLGIGPLRLAPAREAGAIGAAPTRGTSTLLELVRARLDAPLDPARDPLFDLAIDAGDGATRVVLRWWHPCMDERGAELLVRDAARRFAGDSSGPPAADTPDPAAGLSWRERREAFRAANARLHELTKEAPFRLPEPAVDPREKSTAADGDCRSTARSWSCEATTLSAEETARYLVACDREIGARGEGLSQAGLLFAALADQAGGEDEIALPVSVQLRPPRARGPIAANALSFLWYSLPAVLARDRAALAETLRATARRKVAGGEERDAAVLLDLARPMPLWLYRRKVNRRGGGSRFSAAISTLGELFAGAKELFGAPLRDALALTAFPAPPGLGVVFSRAAGRLRIATLSAPSLVDPAAARRLHVRIVDGARELAAAAPAAVR